jgi:hypothetical protein
MNGGRFDRWVRRFGDARLNRRAAVGWLGAFLGWGHSAARARGCGDSRIRCNRQCVDPQTSRTHCGGCGNRCAPSEACIDGTCAPCPSDRVFYQCRTPCHECDSQGNCGHYCCVSPEAPSFCCDLGSVCGDWCCASGERCLNGSRCDHRKKGRRRRSPRYVRLRRPG